MILMVFSVYDKAAKAYLTPFYARAKGEAVRSMLDLVADEKHQFRRHASDYTLYYHGDFDDSSGVFMCGEPERVVGCLELVPDAVEATSGRVVAPELKVEDLEKMRKHRMGE